MFLKVFVMLPVASAFEGATRASTLLASVQAQSDGGLLRLRLSDFPALQRPFGSVRIGTSAIGGDFRPLGLFPPVLIQRGGDGEFYALDSACTHEGCTIPTLDPVSRVCQCPCHGSQFRIDGTVQRGPANFPLRRFTTRYDGLDLLTVELPDVSFSLEAFRVQESASRIRLDFIAFEGIEYELHSRPRLDAEWSGPVPFSLTPTGPADQIIVPGRAHYARVYVEGGHGGLYAVAMRTKAV